MRFKMSTFCAFNSIQSNEEYGDKMQQMTVYPQNAKRHYNF